MPKNLIYSVIRNVIEKPARRMTIEERAKMAEYLTQTMPK